MIGQLPKSLSVNGIDYQIRTDYRVALTIFQAYNDLGLSPQEQALTCIKCLFGDNLPADINEAYKHAIWFLNGGKDNEAHHQKPQLYDWEQDEQIIFSAVNRVAGREIRADEYMHWWTFLGLFNEIGECTFTSVTLIRDKKAKGKKLESYELEFIRENKSLVELNHKLSSSDLKELEDIKRIFK